MNAAAQTSPVDPSSIDDEETHDPTSTRFPGHWRCSCGYVGTDDMMSMHLIRNGWCGDCWGSGSSPYWLDGGQGLCRTCGGSGEIADVERLDRQMARIRRQLLDRRQVRA